jgi:hypothetical protein
MILPMPPAFSTDTLAFLRALKRNNNREWPIIRRRFLNAPLTSPAADR